MFEEKIRAHCIAFVDCFETLQYQKIMILQKLPVVSSQPWKTPWMLEIPQLTWSR